MNRMRLNFKKIAENNVNCIEVDLGDILNNTWEIVRKSSEVIDTCLNVQSILENEKQTNLLLICRNLLSDCCCCLDSLDRGHERTVFNNLRMILEDLCSVIHASEDEKIYKELLTGNHKSPESVSYTKKRYPSHEFGIIYGWLSKISHHKEQGLIVRQWINREGLISHIKPYDSKRRKTLLNAIFTIMHFARFTGEIAEQLCLDKLVTPYFWTTEKKRHPSPPINILVSDIAEKIDRMMQSV